MKTVYCAVQIGSLNKAVCTSSLKGKTTEETYVCIPLVLLELCPSYP